MGTKVNSNYEDLLTFTRASKGHALRPVSYGDELVTNGDFSDGSTGWVLRSNATIAVVSEELKVTVTGTGGGFSDNSQGMTTTVGKIYKVKFDARTGTYSGDFALIINTTAVLYETLTSDMTTYEYVFVADSSNFDLEFARATASTGTVYFDNISVKEVTFDEPDGTLTLFEHPNNVPRVEWDADRNRLGLLVEESRTNLITYSEDFNFWTKLSAVIDSTTVTNPDGTTDGFLFRPTATAPRIFQQISSTTADHAHSVYAKAGGKDLVQVGQYNGSTYEMVLVNLNNGDIVASTGNASVTEMPNGWYRISVTGDSTSTLRYLNISCGDVGDSYADNAISTTADGVSGIYIYGAQVEAGSFPTSYIKTTGSTATRSSDVASIPVSDFGYNQSEGTAFLEFQKNNTDGAYLLDFEGSVSSQINVVNDAELRVRATRSPDVNLTIENPYVASATTRKIAYTIKSGDYAAVLDGGSVQTSASTNATSGISTIYIGSDGGSDLINGHIKSIQYYPRRLTNAQLEALTEPRSTPTLSLTFDGLESSYTENYIHG